MNGTQEAAFTDSQLQLTDLDIMELQTEDAFGIPDLGASTANSLSCSSLCCIIVL